MAHLKKAVSVILVMAVLASTLVITSITAGASGTGVGLAEWALNAYYSGWSYVWGGASPGAVDCSGLIYSYAGGYRVDIIENSDKIGYVSDGIPNIHGLAVWKPGHIGVYVGNDMSVDARGSAYGVCYSNAYSMNWTKWCTVPGVTYPTTGWEEFNGGYYYYENGEYITNTQRTIDGVTYTFGSDGASDKVPENMSGVADGGSSSGGNSGSTQEYYSKGSSGQKVIEIQERLKELGYFHEDITGYFGSVTEAAYKAFQAAAGVTVDGIAGTDMEILFSDSAPYAPTEETTEEPTTEEPTTEAPTEEVTEAPTTEAPTEPEVVDDGIYRYGDFSTEVTAIQQRLKDLGYFEGEVTTFYGEVTEEAVSTFQYVASLPVTGEVDQATYDLLFSETAENFKINIESTEETYMEGNEAEQAEVIEETEAPTEPETTEEPTTEAPTTEATTEAPTTEATEVTTEAPTEAPTTVQAATEVITEASKTSNEAMQSVTNAGVASIGADVKNNGDFVKWFIIIAAVMAASFAFVVFAEKKRFSKARHSRNENKRYK
ncbi:hypothetical protein B5F08_08845 [Anaeromassilibacillus sp. An172]|uniref:C40 family peptidase n=1 Tax=Anaeromassilibacillus sp. An172 TaxID=1965570 RepID=UPI000B373051|nr:peptidoglycan-binding protein [Anaeromassilibacillus sp. An172]OUP77452.1 hypothetical protein B5F08_08845 [Anaeromassilibacillus sp. An172]